jgi:hypothetical protein
MRCPRSLGAGYPAGIRAASAGIDQSADTEEAEDMAELLSAAANREEEFYEK